MDRIELVPDPLLCACESAVTPRSLQALGCQPVSPLFACVDLLYAHGAVDVAGCVQQMFVRSSVHACAGSAICVRMCGFVCAHAWLLVHVGVHVHVGVWTHVRVRVPIVFIRACQVQLVAPCCYIQACQVLVC